MPTQKFNPGLQFGAGSVVQVQRTEYTSLTSANSSIPFDDSIPQISEGTALISVSITPKSTTNILRVEACLYATTWGGYQVTGAVFRDAGADAIFSMGNTSGGEPFSGADDWKS